MFSLAFLAFLIQVAQASVADCGGGSTLFTINSQGFSPEPPVAGQNATLWIDYTVPDGVQVEAGSAKYSYTYNGIPLPGSTEDLCTQIPCPQVPGTFNISSISEWPSGISGKLQSKIQWYDADGTYLLCSQITEKMVDLLGWSGKAWRR